MRKPDNRFTSGVQATHKTPFVQLSTWLQLPWVPTTPPCPDLASTARPVHCSWEGSTHVLPAAEGDPDGSSDADQGIAVTEPLPSRLSKKQNSNTRAG